MARSRAARNLGWLGGGLLVGAALAFLVANIVARTRPGHEWVLKQTLKAIGGQIQGGRLTVARVEGNLFEGARLYGISLVDPQGRAFLAADSAYGKYDVRTLLAPQIVIDSLTLYHPRIWVFKLPGDSLWNYQSIFRDTVPPDTTRPRLERSTDIAWVKFVDGTVRVETPFHADTTLSRAAQQAQLRQFMSDTGEVIIRQVPRGYVRTVNVARLFSTMTKVRFAPGSSLGTRVHVDTLRGNVQFYRKPIVIDYLTGNLSLPGTEMGSTGYARYDSLKTGFVEFDVPDARLPHTRLTLSGVVRFDNYPKWFDPNQGPMYDVAMRSDSLSFRDFQWLYARFPGDMAGKMGLLIETRPGGIMIDARDAHLRAPGTHIDGDFGMILGDTLRFVDVNVDSRPIRTSFIEHLLPQGLPVRGLVLGGVDIRGNHAPPGPADSAAAAPPRRAGAVAHDTATRTPPSTTRRR